MAPQLSASKHMQLISSALFSGYLEQWEDVSKKKVKQQTKLVVKDLIQKKSLEDLI